MVARALLLVGYDIKCLKDFFWFSWYSLKFGDGLETRALLEATEISFYTFSLRNEGIYILQRPNL